MREYGCFAYLSLAGSNVGVVDIWFGLIEPLVCDKSTTLGIDLSVVA